MINYEKPIDINTRFKLGDKVRLSGSMQEDPPILYSIEKIVIDTEAVKYYLKST